jgi:guanylate kinase
MTSPKPSAFDAGQSGSIFLVVAPSGAGKSTLVNALLEKDPGIALSVSHTTRPPRPGESNGREYHFVSVEEFMRLRAAGEFLESAEVHGNYYATSRVWIEQRVRAGTDVLLEIDWQGARQVKQHFSQAVGIFILPPSIDALETRLHRRGQDSAQVITRRLLAAGSEIAHAPEFDYVIINEDFATALAQLGSVVMATRLRYSSQAARHHELFAQLGIG